MNHDASSRATDSSRLHSGAVSMFRLLDLYGESHRAELEELWTAPGTDYLVLFADGTGRDCAILPVGSAHDYSGLKAVLELNIEGLHAVCYTPARDNRGQVPQTPVAAADPPAFPEHPEWAAYEAEFPEETRSLTEALANVAPGPEASQLLALRVLSRLRELSRREAEIVLREHYVHEAEERLGERADAHLVRLAELEQRECDILAATRELEARSKRTDPFDPSSVRPDFAAHLSGPIL